MNMARQRRITDSELERSLKADVNNPDAWEFVATVPASKSARPTWYGRSGHPEPAALEARIAQLEMSLAKYPVPILGVKANKTPSIVGSGFLLHIAHRTFITTAAHVLNEQGDQGLYVPGPNGLHQLAMKIYRTHMDEAHGIDFDLAFNELPADLPGVLSHYASIDIRQADPNHVPSTDTIYSFIGYPASRNKARLDTRTIQPTILPYRAVTLLPEQYEQCGLSTSVHLAVGFDEPNTKYPNGSVATPPNPKGISGCSVWSLGRLPAIDSNVASPQLVGIGIAHMKHPERLEATRIAVLLEAIRQIFPDTSPHIPQSEFFGTSVTLKA